MFTCRFSCLLQYYQSPSSRRSSFLAWLVGRRVGTVPTWCHVSVALCMCFCFRSDHSCIHAVKTQRRSPLLLCYSGQKPDVAATCCCDTIFTTVLVRHTDALMSCCCCWPRKQLKLRLETSTLIKQKKDAWSEVLHLLNEWRSLFSSASSARDKDKEQRLSALASGLQYENFQNGCQ